MKAPRQTPPALAGQVSASYTIFCRSCSTSRTIMASSGKAGVDRETAKRAWARLGWHLDLLYGWECPACVGSIARSLPTVALAARRPGMTLGEATPATVVLGDLCGVDGCPHRGEFEVWLAAAAQGLRVLALVCGTHVRDLAPAERTS